MLESHNTPSEPDVNPLFSDEVVKGMAFFEDVQHLRFMEQVFDEQTWQERYDALYVYLSASTIGKFLGVHAPWVNNHAARLGHKAILTESETKHPIHGYKKEVILELQEILERLPLQGSWLSLLDLQELTGVDRARSKKVLADKNIDYEQRRSNENNIVGRFYPPESEVIVNESKAERAPPAGDWKTDWAIAVALGRSNDWVFLRTAQYKDISEQRTSLSGKEETHHSPVVQAILKRESDVFEVTPFATSEDISLRSLAISVKHGDAWVLDRIPYTSSQMSTKRNFSSHRTYTYLTPNPHDDLIDMPKDVLEMEAQTYLVQRAGWIDTELELLDIRKISLNFAGLRIKHGIEVERNRRKREKDAALALETLRQKRRVPLGPTIPLRDKDMHGKPWQDFAACLDGSPDIFFPEKGESNKDAKKVCGSCRVSEQCLAHAIEKNEQIGIWGGKTPEERRKIKRASQRW
jgi:WhiB family redox-sensing transcriptional regulator